MKSITNPNIRELIADLHERAKELNCLYEVEEILKEFNLDLNVALQKVTEIIPHGWQFEEICCAKITYKNFEFYSQNFIASDFFLESPIYVNDEIVGSIYVYYSPKSNLAVPPFLEEEKKLLNSISDRVGNFIFHKKLQHTFSKLDETQNFSSTKKEWEVIIELLKNTDNALFFRISRKMLNFLLLNGITDAKDLLAKFSNHQSELQNKGYDSNKPLQKENLAYFSKFSEATFYLASKFITDDVIFHNIQKWIKEDKLNYLILTLENLATSLGDVQNALSRYHHLQLDQIKLSYAGEKNINVLCIIRFLTDQLEYINIAKDFVELNDFYELIQHTIYPINSHGKLGGKSSGIFLAKSILKKYKPQNLSINIKFPKTWYITSDAMHQFLYYNNLREVIEQRYKPIEQIREEYPNIIQIFKNSYFAPDIKKSFSVALNDFGKNPIIVRSSSLLEDRIGASFCGKYKSLFLANQGTAEENLNALMDAVAEVYASIFAPDPISYRQEKGLLDFHEEMGIIIQEVVGRKVGDYFFPVFAGVAFSNNEMRWSPRIKRSDGLLRVVPGLGTRAVDRLDKEYPILISPGQPNLRVNVTSEEIYKYSPKKIDVINLRKNTFETKSINELLSIVKDDYPLIDKIVEVFENDRIIKKNLFSLDFDEDEFIITFNSFFEESNFLEDIKKILNLLKEKMTMPIDLEFAFDGEDLYILQCRSQSFYKDLIPMEIPKNIPQKNIFLDLNKFITNGFVPNITHIVFVNPIEYAKLPDFESMKNVGKVISKLNQILPKRKFILIGPGRWGSRGDIKLGVNVTYSDIKNTSLLCEMATKSKDDSPDLSFGTHFFQDLVESSIKYLPIYYTEKNNFFNLDFINRAKNVLNNVIPEFTCLESVIKVIDIKNETNGKILKFAFNADEERALGYFDTDKNENIFFDKFDTIKDENPEQHWIWRMKMAELISSRLDKVKFGVKDIYIFGSTKNAIAGPASDIDLLVHFIGTETQRLLLETWFEGWSISLAELNFLRTGFKTSKLLDIHIITDEDIKNKDSYALKINAITDSAKKLP